MNTPNWKRPSDWLNAEKETTSRFLFDDSFDTCTGGVEERLNESMTQFKPVSDSERRIVEELLSAISITDRRVSVTKGAPIICRGAMAYANQVSISSSSTYFDMAALLNRLIYMAVGYSLFH